MTASRSTVIPSNRACPTPSVFKPRAINARQIEVDAPPQLAKSMPITRTQKAPSNAAIITNPRLSFLNIEASLAINRSRPTRPIGASITVLVKAQARSNTVKVLHTIPTRPETRRKDLRWMANILVATPPSHMRTNETSGPILWLNALWGRSNAAHHAGQSHKRMPQPRWLALWSQHQAALWHWRCESAWCAR